MFLTKGVQIRQYKGLIPTMDFPTFDILKPGFAVDDSTIASINTNEK